MVKKGERKEIRIRLLDDVTGFKLSGLVAGKEMDAIETVSGIFVTTESGRKVRLWHNEFEVIDGNDIPSPD